MRVFEYENITRVQCSDSSNSSTRRNPSCRQWVTPPTQAASASYANLWTYENETAYLVYLLDPNFPPFEVKISTPVTHDVGNVHTNLAFLRLFVLKLKANTRQTDRRTDGRTDKTRRPNVAY